MDEEEAAEEEQAEEEAEEEAGGGGRRDGERVAAGPSRTHGQLEAPGAGEGNQRRPFGEAIAQLRLIQRLTSPSAKVRAMIAWEILRLPLPLSLHPYPYPYPYPYLYPYPYP